NASSIINLDYNSSMSFNCLGSIAAGKTLTILGYSPEISPLYAFRLFGNFLSDSTFLALMGNTTVDGVAALYRFSGTYTDVVAAVPEPSSLILVAGAGIAVLALRRRRFFGRK